MNPWMPGAIRDYGAAAGYAMTYDRADGHNDMRTVKMHFTVGTDSRALIRNVGLAQFLFPKVGPPIQFAEVDAYCLDSGSWNGDGPGLEFERLGYDDPLTTDQLMWGAKCLSWLETNCNFPLTLWDGARVLETDCGFINHGSVLGRGLEHADHTDGVLRDEWDSLLASILPPPAPLPTTGDNHMIIIDYAATTLTFHVTSTGDLVQNTYAFVGGHVVVDKVLLDHNDPHIQPAIVAHGETLSLTCVGSDGHGRFITYLPGTGWIDVNGRKL